MTFRNNIVVGTLLFPLLVVVTAGCAPKKTMEAIRPGVQRFAVASPGGAVELTLLVDNGHLKYSVARGGASVIESSPLVFTIDGVDIASGVISRKVEPYDGNETYPTRGVHFRATDKHHGTRFSFRHLKSGTEYTLEARAFDDGVAYRCIVPGDESKSRVPDERSLFALPAGSTLWYHGLRGHYEGEYVKRDVAEVPAGEWVAPPLTVKLPKAGGYASISEANLVNYSGAALEADGKRGFAIGLGHRQPVSYPYELRYTRDDIARHSQPAKVAGTITTPWRVVIVSPDLNKLVNTDIITSLASPPDEKLFPKGQATPWIRPGRAVWQYLDGGARRDAPADPLATSPPAGAAAAARAQSNDSASPAPATTRPRRRTTPQDMKEFSRLAHELGFEYNVLEGFWNEWSDDEIRDVVNYSNKLGVGLFVWVHSKNLQDPAKRAALWQRVRDTGIRGLKVDFFDHEHKEVIDLYQTLLREGAENKILLDFHGANKPTGEMRTWPNELVREAVRGMEGRTKERARHDVTLPFTRYVVGPAEYTPVHFGDRRADTTWAHQVASAAVFTAPLLTYSGHPQKMLDNPARDMIKSIPATWDETIVLPPSEIGEIAIMARRKGATWFLAAINGPTGRTVRVPLAFLGKGQRRAMIVNDHATDPAAVQVERDSPARASDALTLKLRPGGGFIARFEVVK
jgi:alpha-glucosidase